MVRRRTALRSLDALRMPTVHCRCGVRRAWALDRDAQGAVGADSAPVREVYCTVKLGGGYCCEAWLPDLVAIPISL